MFRAVCVVFHCVAAAAVLRKRNVNFMKAEAKLHGAMNSETATTRHLAAMLNYVTNDTKHVTVAVATMVLLQDAVEYVLSHEQHINEIDAFSDAASGVFGNAVTNNASASIINVPVSLLSTAIEQNIGKLLAPAVKLNALSALRNERKLMSSATAREQILNQVDAAEKLMQQKDMNQSVFKLLAKSGKWMHANIAKRVQYDKLQKQHFANDPDDQTSVDIDGGNDLSMLPPTEIDTTTRTQLPMPNEIADVERLIQELSGDSNSIDVSGINDAELNNKLTVDDSFNLGAICMNGVRRVQTRDRRSECAQYCVVDADSCAKCKKLLIAKVCLEMINYVNEFTNCVADFNIADCIDRYPTKRSNWTFGERYMRQTYAYNVLLDNRLPPTSDRLWWKERLQYAPIVKRQNSVYSGFQAQVKMTFKSGWTIAFAPVQWKGLRFFVHDNFAMSPYRLNPQSGEALPNNGEVKLWNLKNMWENRILSPMVARFEFFRLEHPVNDKLSMGWRFRREYSPFAGYMAVVQLKFKKAKAKANTKIVLVGEVWPFDLITSSIRTPQAEVRMRAGILYQVEFKVSEADSKPKYKTKLVLRVGCGSPKVGTKNKNYVDIFAGFNLEPFVMKELSFAIRSINTAKTNMGLGNEQQFGKEAKVAAKTPNEVIAWNFFRRIMFDNDMNPAATATLSDADATSIVEPVDFDDDHTD